MTQQEARAALKERWLFEEENGLVAVRDAELIRVNQLLQGSRINATLERVQPAQSYLTPAHAS